MEERSEKLAPRGVFHLKVMDECGTILEQYTDDNLIVNGGRNAIATLIGSANAEKDVTDIAFGTNGSSPLVTDTAITGAFTKAVNAVSYPSTGRVQFNWSLELTEGNGMTIREYGLLCDDGTLFARKTRTEIVKNNTIRLEGTWTIIF